VLHYRWDTKKNHQLIADRSVSFEDVILALEEERLLEVLQHPNSKKYPNQKIFVVEIGGYAYYVPFIQNQNEIFLKTIFPNRKATKKYLIE
jgi:uncharacterized DUF497 family protein